MTQQVTLSIPRGLQADLNDAENQKRHKKQVLQTSAEVKRWLERDVAQRPDVKTMQAILRSDCGLKIFSDGNGGHIYLTPEGFRYGRKLRRDRGGKGVDHFALSLGRLSRVIGHHSSDGIKRDIEAKLKSYGDEGIRDDIKFMGRSAAQRDAWQYAKAAGTIVSFPVWGTCKLVNKMTHKYTPPSAPALAPAQYITFWR